MTTNQLQQHHRLQNTILSHHEEHETTPLLSSSPNHHPPHSMRGISGVSGRVDMSHTDAGREDESHQGQRAQKSCYFTLRELVFIVVVLATEIGCNISLDTPGALQNSMMSNYQLTSSQFALFYSLYFIPTIFLNGFSGFLIDRVMGIRLSTLVYSIIGTVGVVLFAVGGVVNFFWLMLMGRLIFGLGNELATGVCVNYCIFAWYRNTIMNLVCSLSSDGSMAGSLVIYQIGPRLLSVLKQTMAERHALDIVICLASGTFIVTAAFAVLLTYLKPKEDAANSDTPANISGATVPEEKIATFSDIIRLPIVFWVLCLLNCFTGCINSFPSFSQGIFTSKVFHLTEDEASNVVSVMGAVKIALSIPLSMSVDLVGRNMMYVLLSTVLQPIAFVLLIFSVNPYSCMVVLGLSQSLYYAAIYPMYAYPLDKHLTGSCYGIMSTAGGLSMFAGPLAVGALIDSFGQIAALYFYFVSSALCLVCGLAVWLLDKRDTGILSMTPVQRVQLEQRLEGSRLFDKLEPSSDYASMPSLTSFSSNVQLL